MMIDGASFATQSIVPAAFKIITIALIVLSNRTTP
jgi:hypothetical protein